MATRSEIVNAVLKGLGMRPTANLLRWSPTLQNPLRFDLVEVNRCEADGGVVTPTSQHLLRAHAGHKVKSPGLYTWWEVFKIQLRLLS